MKKFSHLTPQSTFLVFSLALFLFLSAFQEPEQAGKISPWVWIITLAVLLILFFYWAYRSTRPTAKSETRMGAISTPPDDLTIIEGIGPKIAIVLQTAGITTFDQLAAADVNRLREILKLGDIRIADPSSWSEQARLAAAGDQAGLKSLQDRLIAGRNS